MAQLVLKNILAGSGNVLAGGDNAGNVTKITIGSGLTLSGGVLTSSGGTSLTLTTTGNSGAATLVSGTLNIPNYSLTGLGGVPTTRTLTINGTTYDLSADRTWTIAGGVTSVFGRTGAVVAVSGDYNTDLVTEGSTNLYYTNARARAAFSANVGSALTYNSSTGRYTLLAANSSTAGYVTAADYNYWDAKQQSLGTGTTSQYLRGDLVWSTPPAPSLDELADVTITSPSNGQLLRYTLGGWINFTPTYVAAGFFSATAPLSYNSSTGVFSISQAGSGSNGFLSSTDWNTFNGKQNQLSGNGFVKVSGTSVSYDNSTYLTTSAASSTYLPLTGGTLSGNLTATGFFESSDKRLKKQIEANYAPKNIQNIQTYLYQKDGKIEVGYYAQEVSEIMPYAVAEGKDGFLAVAYNQVLVSKVQYLENKLKDLEHELGRISK
jgi:hypothetical protein